MAADLSYWMARAGRGLTILVFVAAVVVVYYYIITGCTIQIKVWWRSQRMRLFRLGGATTLRRKLNYPCTLCHDSMDAGDKVRTLSCDHVFHRGGTAKCANGIDKWLLTGAGAGAAMSWQSCPICHQDPQPVRLWKRPPPSSPAVTSPGSSAPALPPQLLPRTSSTQDLEEALLAHHPERDDDDTPPPPPPPDASSSSSASAPPPLAQLPPPSTSASDLEEASPALAEDEEIVPWASSSSQ